MCHTLILDFEDPISGFWSRTPSIALDLVAHRTYLNGSRMGVFPNLTTLRVRDLIEWRRSRVGDEWRPYCANKEKLKELLEIPTKCPAYDVNGCLAGAFPPGELDVRTLDRIVPAQEQVAGLTR